MRNYGELLGRVADWLRPDGKLLRPRLLPPRRAPTRSRPTATTNWMGRHFFTGGIMPSARSASSGSTSGPDRRRAVVAGTARTTSGPPRPGCGISRTGGPRRCRSSRGRTARRTRRAGTTAGACSSWRARSCSVSTAGGSGGSRTRVWSCGRRGRDAAARDGAGRLVRPSRGTSVAALTCALAFNAENRGGPRSARGDGIGFGWELVARGQLAVLNSSSHSTRRTAALRGEFLRSLRGRISPRCAA